MYLRETIYGSSVQQTSRFYKSIGMVSLFAIFSALPYGVYANESKTVAYDIESSSPQQAARKTVKGVVIDDLGEPLPGATITVVGTPRGVVTDIDGTFTIDVLSTDQLSVTYLGMETKVIKVGDKKIFSVTLSPKVDELDEVTVVAFAKQKKESVIASVSTVKVGDLKVPSSNLTTALAGRMSGLIAYQTTGEPGKDNANFFIRGITTFSEQARNPLILIDGVELGPDDLARLNTDDIATFSLMKDATATALYGARGANGVVLVTTKEGKEGKAKFSVRFENSFSSATEDVQLADPITYMKLHNEAVLTRDPLDAVLYTNKDIAMREAGANRYVYPMTDWKNMLFKDMTTNQRVNVNLSGGGTVARYYVAGSFMQDNGVLNVDKRNNFNNNINLKKYLIRSNVNINVTKSTEVIVRLHATFDDYNGPISGGQNLYGQVMKSNPVLFPAYYEPDETYRHANHILFGNDNAASFVNPYAEMVKGYKEYSTSLMMAQFELKQDLTFLTKGLSARLMMNTSRSAYFDVVRQYKPYYYTIASHDQVSDTYKLTSTNTTGEEFLSYEPGKKDVSSTMYMEAAAQYNREFGKHSVGGLLVYQMRNSLTGNAGSLQLSLPSRNIGLSGRFTYGFDSRYFAEFNFGYNGSERFAESERFGFFPSAGIGWLVSNENFWTGNLKKVMNKLKLKATYGIVGNDQIGSGQDRFFYLSQVDPNAGNAGYTFGKENGYTKNGVTTSRYADPYITWETAHKQNYGIEIGLWDAVDIQVDYFRETRSNILQERSYIPSTMGLAVTPFSNVGEAFGQGLDFSLDYQHSFRNNLWLSARGTFTYATSEYKIFEEPAYLTTPWRLRVGQSLGQTWGLVAERLFVSEEEIKNSPKQFGIYKAGDIKYKDINNDGVINGQDEVPIGYPRTPEINYGFGFSAGWKNVDFSMFFQGSARSSFWVDAKSIAPFVQNGGKGGQLMKEISENHWSEANRDLHAFWPRLSAGSIENNEKTSTWFMRDGSFIRLKSLEIGYTVPKVWSKKVKSDKIRIYLSGSNLLCWSKFKLWDTEMGGNGLGYPVQRVFNIGINCDF